MMESILIELEDSLRRSLGIVLPKIPTYSWYDCGKHRLNVPYNAGGRSLEAAQLPILNSL